MADLKGQQPRDIGELLDELTVKMERVRVLYEQYFMGIEKIEPLVARKEVQRAMLLLQQQHIRNTGLRFKFNMMLQKWNIHVTYWNRILREIEGGTYQRHVLKAQRAAQREGKTLPDELLLGKARTAGTFDTGVVARRNPLDDDSDVHLVATVKGGPPPSPKTDPSLERIPMPTRGPLFPPPPPADAARAAQRPPPIPPGQPRPPAGPPPLPPVPGMNELELRELHRKFVETRRQTGEAAQVSYETLVNSLAKQVPRVLEQPGVKSVKFDVTMQNGKAILKAIPQKK